MKQLKLSARLWCLCSCLAFAFAPTPVAAEFVFDSGAAVLSDSVLLRSLTSDSDAALISADRFSLEQATVINRVEWWGSHPPLASASPSGSFTIQIFNADEAGPAADRLFSQTVGSGSPALTQGYGSGVHAYSADVSGVHLAQGDYYLSIFNTTGAGTTDDWLWLAAARRSGTAYQQNLNDGSWAEFSHGGEATMAYRLRGVTAVPEPASLATLAFCVTIGCGGAGRLWRKRQAQRAALN